MGFQKRVLRCVALYLVSFSVAPSATAMCGFQPYYACPATPCACMPMAWPVSYTYFLGGGNPMTIKVLADSWYSTSYPDSPWYGRGWSSDSAWGVFSAQAGDKVLITAQSSDTRLHPGISVFYPRKGNTAPFNYVPDNNYPQNANWINLNAYDETLYARVGDVKFKLVAFGYDQDSNDLIANLNPIQDGVEGLLKLEFIVPSSGIYKFVVGGIHPGGDITNAVDVGVSVMLAGKTCAAAKP